MVYLYFSRMCSAAATLPMGTFGPKKEQRLTAQQEMQREIEVRFYRYRFAAHKKTYQISCTNRSSSSSTTSATVFPLETDSSFFLAKKWGVKMRGRTKNRRKVAEENH